MESIASLISDHFVPHWPFFFMAMALGTIVQFFKKVVWTPRAAENRLWKFGYQTMGMHAPLLGALAGFIGFPASPGVDTVHGRILYHFVAGIISAWVVAGFRHFMKSRGIEIEE